MTIEVLALKYTIIALGVTMVLWGLNQAEVFKKPIFKKIVGWSYIFIGLAITLIALLSF